LEEITARMAAASEAEEAEEREVKEVEEAKAIAEGRVLREWLVERWVLLDDGMEGLALMERMAEKKGWRVIVADAILGGIICNVCTVWVQHDMTIA
jgi:hypothetical protein